MPTVRLRAQVLVGEAGPGLLLGLRVGAGEGRGEEWVRCRYQPGKLAVNADISGVAKRYLVARRTGPNVTGIRSGSAESKSRLPSDGISGNEHLLSTCVYFIRKGAFSQMPLNIKLVKRLPRRAKRNIWRGWWKNQRGEIAGNNRHEQRSNWRGIWDELRAPN
jgi:hypothetical protein